MSPESRKIVPCPHPKPKGKNGKPRKVCKKCQRDRKRVYDRNYEIHVRRKRKALKG